MRRYRQRETRPVHGAVAPQPAPASGVDGRDLVLGQVDVHHRQPAPDLCLDELVQAAEAGFALIGVHFDIAQARPPCERA